MKTKESEMKKKSLMLAMALVLGLATVAKAATINGAGATFPYPIYSKWFYEYNKKTGVKINYQSIGSGGGIRQVSEGTVDFGATDGIMSPEQMSKIKDGILHLPTVMGAVVLVYNVPGVAAGVKMTPEVLSGIFMGSITKWNDPALKSLNSDVKLPDTNITVVHRSDGSGTTNIFTDYLSKVSTAWASQVGKGTAVKWPAGVGGKGNEGVAGLVKQIPGAIGYVELSYARQNKLSYALLKNKAGNYPEPSVESVKAAAAGALKNMPSDFRVMITNQPGANAYPISGFTWLLLYTKYDANKGKDLVGFLKWAYDNGGEMAESLDYAPLPASLIEKVKAKLATIKY
jgi:phosphate transport system substrate-binding protein